MSVFPNEKDYTLLEKCLFIGKSKHFEECCTNNVFLVKQTDSFNEMRAKYSIYRKKWNKNCPDTEFSTIKIYSFF